MDHDRPRRQISDGMHFAQPWMLRGDLDVDLELICMDLLEHDVEHNDLSEARAMLENMGINC